MLFLGWSRLYFDIKINDVFIFIMDLFFMQKKCVKGLTKCVRMIIINLQLVESYYQLKTKNGGYEFELRQNAGLSLRTYIGWTEACELNRA